MKTKFFIYPQLNSLFYRTAIEAEILFAVCLSKKQALTGGKSLACEDKCSKKIGAVLVQQAYRRSFEASAVPILVYFYIIMINKYRQSAKRRLLLSNPTDRTFENRHDGCKERKKINRRRIFDTLRINFFEATPQTACIFSKEDYRYDANGYITAEKDGKFSDKEEITFTYSYFAEHDVYGVDYGFDLDPLKMTLQT